MSKRIKVILYGLGHLGRSIAKLVLEKKEGLEIVGAVDCACNLVGKDVGEASGVGRKIGITLTKDPDGLFSKVKADIVIHTTGSYLRDIYPQIAGCIKAGLNVVSSCEELSYPYYKYPQLSVQIDKLAKKHGVTVLGTGINPGFIMDILPIVLTGVCQDVRSLKVTRMMYSGDRRTSYQKKIGTGMAPEEFKRMIKEGKITGHVGLVESIAMIADALRWKLDDIKELPVEAVVSDMEEKTWTDPTKQTPYIKVKPGQVAGLKSVAHGIKGGKKVVVLEFISHVNVKEPFDSVSIEGVPNVHAKIDEGVHGDVGTVAMIVNSIPKVINAVPGLLTMKDLPVPSAAV